MDSEHKTQSDGFFTSPLRGSVQNDDTSEWGEHGAAATPLRHAFFYGDRRHPVYPYGKRAVLFRTVKDPLAL